MRFVIRIAMATALAATITVPALSGETKDAYQATEQIGTCEAWGTFLDSYGQTAEQSDGFMARLACMMPGAECEERALFAKLAVQQKEIACRIDPWERTFGGKARDALTTATALPDGSVLAVGQVASKGAGDVDGWLLHIDARGELLWDRTFGGIEEDIFTRIVGLPDGGALIVGGTKSKGAGDADGWVVRVNSTGDLVWEQTFGGKEEDYLRSIAVLPDGGALIAGATKSKRTQDYDGWVVRIDSDGTKLWDRMYGGSQEDRFAEILALPEGDALIVGNTVSMGARSQDGWVVRIDGQGEVQWERTFGGEGYDSFNTIAPVPAGDVLITGSTHSKGEGVEGWIVRMDVQGEPVWERTYGAYDLAILYGGTLLPDGSALAVGMTDNYDGWLIHINSDGELLRSSVSGGAGLDYFDSISVLPDGSSVLAVGQTASKGAGDSDGWLLRLDADLNAPGVKPGPNDPDSLVNNATAELTRVLAAHILNNEGRSFACVSGLTFKESGFENAKTQGVIVWKEVKTMRELRKSFSGGIEHRLAGLPEESPWRVVEPAVGKPRVQRMGGDDECRSGRAAIRAIADMPFAPNVGSYKKVEFTEWVSLPPELKPLQPHIYTGYNNSIMFQRTDQGWRAQK